MCPRSIGVENGQNIEVSVTTTNCERLQLTVRPTADVEDTLREALSLRPTQTFVVLFDGLPISGTFEEHGIEEMAKLQVAIPSDLDWSWAMLDGTPVDTFQAADDDWWALSELLSVVRVTCGQDTDCEDEYGEGSKCGVVAVGGSRYFPETPEAVLAFLKGEGGHVPVIIGHDYNPVYATAPGEPRWSSGPVRRISLENEEGGPDSEPDHEPLWSRTPWFNITRPGLSQVESVDALWAAGGRPSRLGWGEQRGEYMTHTVYDAEQAASLLTCTWRSDVATGVAERDQCRYYIWTGPEKMDEASEEAYDEDAYTAALRADSRRASFYFILAANPMKRTLAFVFTSTWWM